LTFYSQSHQKPHSSPPTYFYSFIYMFICLFIYLETGFCNKAQAGLGTLHPSVSAFSVLGLQACTTTPGFYPCPS
jgi:hypothetical protein